MNEPLLQRKEYTMDEENTFTSPAGTVISKEDLVAIDTAKTQLQLASAAAEKAAADNKVAELTYRNTILTVYVKYGLSMNQVIDEKTGKVLEQGQPGSQ